MNCSLKNTLISFVIGLVLITPLIILVLWLADNYPDDAYLFWLWLGIMVHPTNALSESITKQVSCK